MVPVDKFWISSPAAFPRSLDRHDRAPPHPGNLIKIDHLWTNDNYASVGTATDLPPRFRTIDNVRDWLPIRRERCGSRGSRKSRWARTTRSCRREARGKDQE